MIDLTTAKAHCRVYYSDDDDVIERLIAVATDHLKSIGVDTETTPVPIAVDHAILMLVGHFYEHREAETMVQTTMVQLGVDRLVAPYREQAL